MQIIVLDTNTCQPYGFPILSVKPTSKFDCLKDILQIGLAQLLCLFLCIYVFQAWHQVMRTRTDCPNWMTRHRLLPRHMGKVRKFVIWKSRSNCIAQGQRANERNRIVVQWRGGPIGNHMVRFLFANELCTSACGMFWTSFMNCNRFEATNPPAISRSDFRLACPAIRLCLFCLSHKRLTIRTDTPLFSSM